MKPPTNQQELIDRLKARIKELEKQNKELDRLLESWRRLP